MILQSFNAPPSILALTSLPRIRSFAVSVHFAIPGSALRHVAHNEFLFFSFPL